MRRYFVALPLPEDVRDALRTVQPCSMPGMRRVDRDQFHVTLHFLGELTETECDQTKQALSKVHATDFQLTLHGLGVFPNPRYPTVLWAGVDVSPALVELHRVVGTVLTEAIGFQPEARPYCPHVTLARFTPASSPIAIARHVQDHLDFAVAGIQARAVVLFCSVIADGKPRYQEQAIYRLG